MIHNGLLTVKLNSISKFNIFILEELVDNFMQYEDKNLRVYAGNDSDNFLLFAHPQKTDIKDSIINLVTNIKTIKSDSEQSTELRNPYLVIRLWLKWELLDIEAMIEAVMGKTKLETKKN